MSKKEVIINFKLLLERLENLKTLNKYNRIPESLKEPITYLILRIEKMLSEASLFITPEGFSGESLQLLKEADLLLKEYYELTQVH